MWLSVVLLAGLTELEPCAAAEDYLRRTESLLAAGLLSNQTMPSLGAAESCSDPKVRAQVRLRKATLELRRAVDAKSSYGSSKDQAIGTTGGPPNPKAVHEKPAAGYARPGHGTASPSESADAPKPEQKKSEVVAKEASVPDPARNLYVALMEFRGKCLSVDSIAMQGPQKQDPACEPEGYRVFVSGLSVYLEAAIKAREKSPHLLENVRLILGVLRGELGRSLARAAVAANGTRGTTFTNEQLASLSPQLAAIVKAGADENAIYGYFLNLAHDRPEEAKVQLAKLEALRDIGNARRMLASLNAEGATILIDTSLVDQTCKSGPRPAAVIQEVAKTSISATPALGRLLVNEGKACPGSEAKNCDATYRFRLEGAECASVGRECTLVLELEIPARGGGQVPERAKLAGSLCRGDKSDSLADATRRLLSNMTTTVSQAYQTETAWITSVAASIPGEFARSCPSTAPFEQTLGGYILYLPRGDGPGPLAALGREMRVSLRMHPAFSSIQDETTTSQALRGVHLSFAQTGTQLDFAVRREPAAGAHPHKFTFAPVDELSDAVVPSIALAASVCLTQLFRPLARSGTTSISRAEESDGNGHQGKKNGRRSKAWNLLWAGLPYLTDGDPRNDATGRTLATADAISTGATVALLAAGTLTRLLYSHGTIESLTPTRGLNLGAAVMISFTAGWRFYGLGDY